MKTATKIISGAAVILGILLIGGCGDLLLQPAATPAPAPTPEAAPTLAQKIRGIWMVGGVSGGTVATAVAQVDLFDPVTSTWYASVTTLPTPVSFCGAAGYTRPLDGHHLIIVMGGFSAAGDTQNIVQIYDVDSGASGTWSSGTSMPQARANISATLVYDKVYVLGGSGAAAATSATTGYAPNSTTYEYTIGSTWNPTKVSFGAAGTERFGYAYGDVIYNLAGRTAGATVVATHDGIAVSAPPAPTGAVTSGTEIAVPIGRAGLAGALWKPSFGPATLVLVGGYTALTNATPQYFITNNVTASTPSNVVYTLAYPFTLPVAWGTPTAFPLTVGFGAAAIYGNTFYHFGGTTALIPASASGDSSVRYGSLTALPSITWSSASSMPVGRYGHSAVTFP